MSLVTANRRRLAVLENERRVVIEKPLSSVSEHPNVAWFCYADGANIGIVPGDIEFGPCYVLTWGNITGHSETVTPTASVWWVWVKINMVDETAAMLSGGTGVTALTAEERETYLIKRICYAEMGMVNVENVLCYQVGNIFVPRSA